MVSPKHSRISPRQSHQPRSQKKMREVVNIREIIDLRALRQRIVQHENWVQDPTVGAPLNLENTDIRLALREAECARRAGVLQEANPLQNRCLNDANFRDCLGIIPELFAGSSLVRTIFPASISFQTYTDELTRTMRIRQIALSLFFAMAVYTLLTFMSVSELLWATPQARVTVPLGNIALPVRFLLATALIPSLLLLGVERLMQKRSATLRASLPTRFTDGNMPRPEATIVYRLLLGGGLLLVSIFWMRCFALHLFPVTLWQSLLLALMGTMLMREADFRKYSLREMNLSGIKMFLELATVLGGFSTFALQTPSLLFYAKVKDRLYTVQRNPARVARVEGSNLSNFSDFSNFSEIREYRESQRTEEASLGEILHQGNLPHYFLSLPGFTSGIVLADKNIATPPPGWMEPVALPDPLKKWPENLVPKNKDERADKESRDQQRRANQQARRDYLQQIRTVQGAQLQGASLAYLEAPQLQAANSHFEGIDATGANFHQGYLPGVYLTSSKDNVPTRLNFSDFNGANLSFAQGEGIQATHSDFQQAILDEANFSLADFTASNFSHAQLRHANLAGAYLRDACLSNAYALEVQCQGAYLGHAVLSDANLSLSCFDDSDLNSASLAHADLTDASARFAHLQEANLQGARLVCANFQGADLRGADLTQAIVTDLNADQAIFSDTTMWSTGTAWPDSVLARRYRAVPMRDKEGTLIPHVYTLETIKLASTKQERKKSDKK